MIEKKSLKWRPNVVRSMIAVKFQRFCLTWGTRGTWKLTVANRSHQAEDAEKETQPHLVNAELPQLFLVAESKQDFLMQ